MKIHSLVIENFRGINKVEARSLGDTVIIAGQNGSGKSCIFDAIRLLKSTYGGYQQNEWQHFFGEFAIQLHGGAKYLRGLFNDHSKPVVIECEFGLRDSEKAYLSENLAELLEETIWQTLLPEAFQWGGYKKALFANQFRERQPEVSARVAAELPQLRESLTSQRAVGKITITTEGTVVIDDSRLLSVVFTSYKPRHIGVIDFHGAQRHYGRENVQGINLNLDQTNQQYSQHTLYNYNNKYNNVKSEMAGNFIKELLAEKSSPTGRQENSESLSETLKELFESFFPEKKFRGPQPTSEGSLSFPVTTPNGTEHDLDELSSGEKEILYGYLRIRSSAPRNSIILLDEPELHLNPRLIRGLPEFYRKHLGEALENQIWLVTHSDALIREAVGKPGFNVFHMLPCSANSVGQSQLRPLTATHQLEMAITDLVGDLAAYRPGGKGVLFEGGGDSDFDKRLVNMLFTEELKGINLLSGSNKVRVKQLHEILERAYNNGDLPTKFYAITDRDSEDAEEQNQAVTRFVWDVYHVENYLLVPVVIRDVLISLDISATVSEAEVHDGLQKAAREVVPQMIQHRMRSFANGKLVGSIDLRFDPSSTNVAREIYGAVTRSLTRINAVAASELTEDALEEQEKRLRLDIEQSFADGSWLSKIPGREVLRRYCSRRNITTGYEAFRNLIASRMASIGYKPLGMSTVVNRIAND